MAETRNLCAQIPVDLHAKVIEEKNETLAGVGTQHFHQFRQTVQLGFLQHVIL